MRLTFLLTISAALSAFSSFLSDVWPKRYSTAWTTLKVSVATSAIGIPSSSARLMMMGAG